MNIKINEYDLKTANARPHAIITGSDGALWFTQWGSNQIGRITTSGEIMEYEIPTANSEPHGIAVGADKAIWFAEECNKIGQLILL